MEFSISEVVGNLNSQNKFILQNEIFKIWNRRISRPTKQTHFNMSNSFIFIKTKSVYNNLLFVKSAKLVHQIISIVPIPFHSLIS